MQRDDDRLLTFDITRAGERILSYTSEGRDAFMADPRTQDAVIRNLEIIGEAAGKLSDATKDAAAGVEWRRVVGMRNLLIHGYRDVNLETVWQVVAEELAPLLAAVRTLSDP